MCSRKSMVLFQLCVLVYNLHRLVGYIDHKLEQTNIAMEPGIENDDFPELT